MLNILRNTWHSMRAERRKAASRYGALLAELPDTLLPYWKKTAQHEFKGIPTDAFFYVRAAEGLLTFFDCVRHSARPCGLPAMAADSVWHAWLRMDEKGLQRFCRRHFGREIVHVEAHRMPGCMKTAMAACLVQARLLEGMPGAGPRLPALFTLDRDLRMPRGAGYLKAGRDYYHARLDHKGRRSGSLARQDFLAPAALLAAGLISEEAYASCLKKEVKSSASSGGGEAVGGDSSSCEDGNDGGDGDGGGCGGGCGG